MWSRAAIGFGFLGVAIALGKSIVRSFAVGRSQVYKGQIKGLSQIKNSYDMFILDQYGVLHDGKTAG